jgi:hypothetical protein
VLHFAYLFVVLLYVFLRNPSLVPTAQRFDLLLERRQKDYLGFKGLYSLSGLVILNIQMKFWRIWILICAAMQPIHCFYFGRLI